MVLFVGPENFTKELASCFHALVTDRKSIVRRTISCGFHEVQYTDTTLFFVNASPKISESIVVEYLYLQYVTKLFFSNECIGI
jgi:hypothetical protein